MARPVFRPIIFALKRAPTWPGTIIPYEPPEPTWVLESGIWRNVGYWFDDRTSWNNGAYVESEAPIYDGMPEDQVIGTIKYVIDLFDGAGADNISSPQAATVKLNQIAYQSGLLTRLTDIMAGSDAMDIINQLLYTLTEGGGVPAGYGVLKASESQTIKVGSDRILIPLRAA